jgi:hypothetical protein
MRFVFSEPQVEAGRFAIGIVAAETFAEVRADYLEPILVSRFPLDLLHPDSVVHLIREAPLSDILRARPTPAGAFLAVLPRRYDSVRERVQDALRSAGFTPLDENQWQLEVKD